MARPIAGTGTPGSQAAPASPAKTGVQAASSPAGNAPAATAGPAVQPASPGVPGVGGDGASSPPPSPAPTVRQVKRVSVVPGVTPDPAGDDELGGESHDEETGYARVLSERDQENPPEEAPPANPPATGAGAEAGGEPPAGEQPPAKFKLQDVEFESEAHAAHAYKTLRGQASAVAQKHRELSAQQTELIQALASAGLTLQGGKVVRGENPPPAAGSPGAPPQAPSPDSEGSPDLSTPEGVQSFLDTALNWKQLPQIIKYYEEQHGQTLGPAVAMRLVLENVLPKLWSATASHVGRTVEPFQNMAHSVQASTAVRDLFVGMRDYTFHDGTPAYPEFSSDEGTSAIYQVWLDLGNQGVPPKLLMSPQGIALAASFYRDFQAMKGRAGGGGNGNRTPNPPTVPSNSPSQGVGNVDAATAAVQRVMQSLESARGSVSPDLVGDGRPFRPGAEAEGSIERLKRAIREARGKEIVPGVRYS